MAYTTEGYGQKHTELYRLYMKNEDDELISPFHDVPLLAKASDSTNPVYNMIVEIPRHGIAKMEIDPKAPLNPIKQDMKNGKVRFLPNLYPYKGYPTNYGCLPQTWENPDIVEKYTKCKGDGDPIDVCEIGRAIHSCGDVVQVKVLGCLALIDEGEADWKVIAIDVNDPLADQINDIMDVEQFMPMYLNGIRDFLKYYKVPGGKPVNKFGFEGQFKPAHFTKGVIAKCHSEWKQLVSGEIENTHGILMKHTTEQDGVNGCISPEEARRIFIQGSSIVFNPLNKPFEWDPSLDRYSFVRREILPKKQSCTIS